MSQQQANHFLMYALSAIGYQLSTSVGAQSIRCRYINNPDGSVRWIWPADASEPMMLRFYYAGSWKSRLYTYVVKFLFAIGAQRLLSHGTCSVQASHQTTPGIVLQPGNWALFTGTKGPNRKLVLYTHQSGGRFVKIPYGPKAYAILAKEKEALIIMQRRPLSAVKVPFLTASTEAYAIQQNVAAGMQVAPTGIMQVPQAALQQWVLQQVHQKKVLQSSSYAQIKERVTTLLQLQESRIPNALLQKLSHLLKVVSEQQNLYVSPAHGDCTPWNMLVNQSEIALIDWELYKHEAPALYDVFHYHYQSGILIGNKGFQYIRTQIGEWENAWTAQLKNEGLHAATQEQWYLLDVISYYALLYHHQPQWHMQINWLLQTWSDALTYWLAKTGFAHDREMLLADLGAWLKPTPHAALKLHIPQLTDLALDSDLDICSTKENATALSKWLAKHPLCKQLVSRSRSNMRQLAVYLHSGAVLHIDMIWTFKRKSTVFLSSAVVLANATNTGKGILVASEAHDITYTWLFYALNNAALPNKYHQLMEAAPQAVQQEACAMLQQITGQEITPQTLGTISKAQRQAAQIGVNRLPANRGFHKLYYITQYAIDMLRDWKNNRGFIITFSGVDGAGKSTIIEATRHHVEKVMRKKVVVLRHRPSLFPILSAWKHGKKAAEQKAAQTLPRQGNNTSSIGSMFRFAYYYTDYLLGQFYIQLKYVMRGYVVLYDRYYFDFINDSKRSNIQLPRSITAAGYSLLLKPKLNFFLWATPEEILSRKQELNKETIEVLTRDYMQLFEQMQQRYTSSTYAPIHNQDLKHTLQTIFSQIQAAA